MKKWVIFLFMIIAGSSHSDSAAELLQGKINAIHTMSASFKQVVEAENRVISRSSGHMALSRPGRFRWDTKKPMEQLVIADGKRMWVYDVELEQVTVSKQQKQLTGTAALFLSRYDNKVTEDYKVSMRRHGDSQIFDLHPKKTGRNFQRIKMKFQDGTLRGMDLYDQLGQVTTVKLQQVKLNIKLKNKLFEFSPPDGVDVVKQ